MRRKTLKYGKLYKITLKQSARKDKPYITCKGFKLGCRDDVIYVSAHDMDIILKLIDSDVIKSIQEIGICYIIGSLYRISKSSDRTLLHKG